MSEERQENRHPICPRRPWTQGPERIPQAPAGDANETGSDCLIREVHRFERLAPELVHHGDTKDTAGAGGWGVFIASSRYLISIYHDENTVRSNGAARIHEDLGSGSITSDKRHDMHVNGLEVCMSFNLAERPHEISLCSRKQHLHAKCHVRFEKVGKPNGPLPHQSSGTIEACYYQDGRFEKNNNHRSGRRRD